MNKKLEAKNRELEQKNEEITGFAFVAIHDMKKLNEDPNLCPTICKKDFSGISTPAGQTGV